MAASREAYALNALELLAARTGEAAFAETLASTRLSGKRLGEAYELIRALAPFEPIVRLLLSKGEK